MKQSQASKTTTIDAYLTSCSDEVRPLLERIREIIRQEAPTATEKISYGMPTFYLQGNLVHFAATKHHIGFYPTPSAIEAFQSELKGYTWSKGAVQFPLSKKLPEHLIRKMVRFRVNEMLGEAHTD